LKKLIYLLFLSNIYLLSCINFSDQQGVDNLWRVEANLNDIQIGKTTQSDIIELLGPPSQIINLENGGVFYYLLQKGEGKGIFLLLYNTKNEKVIYDRAIFFFDDRGVLTDYGLSDEKIDRND